MSILEYMKGVHKVLLSITVLLVANIWLKYLNFFHFFLFFFSWKIYHYLVLLYNELGFQIIKALVDSFCKINELN